MDALKYLEKKYGRLTFGAALKADRMAEEFNQEQLAEKVGLSKMAISRFENGKDFPTAETAGLLAKALKMDSVTYGVLIVRDMAEKKGFKGIEVRPRKAS